MESVYAFLDLEAAVTLLHQNVADHFGQAGKHRIQRLVGLHSVRDVKVESVTLVICCLDRDFISHTHMLTDVNVASHVPHITSSLPHHLNIERYPEFCIIV